MFIWNLKNDWQNSCKWKNRLSIHMDSQQWPVQLQLIANEATWFLCESIEKSFIVRLNIFKKIEKFSQQNGFSSITVTNV